MNHFVASLIFMLCSSFSIGQEAKLLIEKPIHKFSDVKEGEMLTHTFYLKNSGTVPLIIHEYKVACPCTKVVLPTKPILAGETFALKMTFDSKGKTYLQDRFISLITNTKKGEEKVRFKVYVIPENE